MQALQRKLVRVVTENEALRHVVDKLQCTTLSFRRQLQKAKLKPEVAVDESLLSPTPHEVCLRSIGHKTLIALSVTFCQHTCSIAKLLLLVVIVV